MIRVDGLLYRAGSFELDVSRFHLAAGELHVLLGPTGSGKTLLLEYIAGLLPRAKGTIAIGGADVGALPPERRHVSYVTQDLALFPTMTVEENIEFGLRFGRAESTQLLDSLIEVTGVGDLLERFPGTLSGGERQRVALVRALAPGPMAVLLDEPFSALHPGLRVSMWRLLRQIHRQMGLSILMVSHDVEEALALGDVISYIEGGSIRQTSRRKEVYYHPRSLGLARFFGFENVFSGRVESVADESVFLRGDAFGVVEVARSHRLTGISVGDRVWWGIHSEEITVVRPERVHVPRSNYFNGVVASQVDVGRSRVAIVEIDRRAGATRTALELTLPEHAARRLKVTEGQFIHLQLKPDRIFVIRDPQ